jgi:hypothetical protein
VGMTTWFYEKRIDNIDAKWKMDQSRMKSTYETKLNKLEITVERIKAECEKKMASLPQTTDTVPERQRQKDESATDDPGSQLQNKTCELINPLPEKSITWFETDLQIEGNAENMDLVWVVAKSVDQTKNACWVSSAKVKQDNLWETTIQLAAPTGDSEMRYNIYIYPDNTYNNHYFGDLVANMGLKRAVIDLPYKEPVDYCNTVEVKRRNGRQPM